MESPITKETKRGKIKIQRTARLSTAHRFSARIRIEEDIVVVDTSPQKMERIEDQDRIRSKVELTDGHAPLNFPVDHSQLLVSNPRRACV